MGPAVSGGRIGFSIREIFVAYCVVGGVMPTAISW
jgi:hypothetical protein